MRSQSSDDDRLHDGEELGEFSTTVDPVEGLGTSGFMNPQSYRP